MTAPIHFNHLYLILPDRVYRTILTSDFLSSAFPGVERRITKTAAGERWSGAYFYTRENYLEFFPASAGFWQEEASEGWGGVAFSVDAPGGALQARQTLEAAFGDPPFFTLRDLQVGSRTIHWFYYTRIAERLGLESFDSWVMEYTPDIFYFKGLEVPASKLLTRQAYLSQWNRPRPVKVGTSQPVFSKVIAATLRMSEEPAALYGEALERLGYTQKVEEGVRVITGPADSCEFTLRLLPEAPTENRYTIRSVTLALARPIRPVSFVFAPGSRLDILENKTAEWFFGE